MYIFYSLPVPVLVEIVVFHVNANDDSGKVPDYDEDGRSVGR